jgi:hypothetical protein
MINFALNVSQHQGISPLADSMVYPKLLGTKYARAASALEKSGSGILLTDLSIAIFDELVPSERLAQMSFIDVVRYRKETAGAREVFLEHLAALHTKQGIVHSDYSAAIKNIIVGDILPEARKFKNALDNVYEKLIGTLAAGAFLYAGSGAALQIFGDISWVNLLGLAGAVGAAVGAASISAVADVRAARRDCAISYVLGLEK